MAPRRLCGLALAAWLAAVAAAGPAAAGTGAAAPAGAVEEARFRLEAGQPREAIRLLRAATPRTSEATLLLARAYLDDGNDFWALRTLLERPDDPEARLWLAFLQLKQGGLDDVGATLGETAVPERSALAARRALLEALVASTRGEAGPAREALARAADADELFPEDAAALAQLRSALDPGHRPWLSGRLEVQTGWTSDGLAGSPLDPAERGDPTPSGLAQLAASLRVTPPLEAFARPSLELELRGLGLAEEAARDLSYLQASARPGVTLGRGGAWFAGYRFELLGVTGEDRYADGPHLFSHAHRAEAEAVFAAADLTAFAGAGQRTFRELARERREVDGGLGFGFRPAGGVEALGALTARLHDARDPAWNLHGVTALLSADVALARATSLRLGAVLSRDVYPDSAGRFAPGAAAREDTLFRPAATVWFAAGDGLRAGVGYEPSWRRSTVEGYGHGDHRVLARALWTFAADPGGPRVAAPPGHVPLAWGLGSGAGLQDRISELLRQDEAIRRGSTCLE